MHPDGRLPSGCDSLPEDYTLSLKERHAFIFSDSFSLGLPRFRGLALIAAAAALGLALIAPAAAPAAFSRPFLRQITGIAPNASFSGPGGVAVDAEDNLWVGDHLREPPFNLDRFDPGGSFLETLEIEGLSPPFGGLTPPASLAINRSSGSFYATAKNTTVNTAPYVEVFDNTGAFIKRFGPFESPAHVAVDNSSEPSAGSVYVASGGSRAIFKFNASGEPVNFSGSAPYLSTNKITGTPSQSFENCCTQTPLAIAVDSHGNIYVVNGHVGVGEEAVDEFAPSGLFVGEFTGAETPGLGEHRENGGFGGALMGLAVDDSVSGHVHVLVGVSRFGPTKGGSNAALEGAVDEFDAPSGRFLSQIAATSTGHPLRSALEMTVDSQGRLYVVDSGFKEDTEEQEHAVDVWDAGRFLPSLTPADVTELKPADAVLNGFVNPEALVNPEASGLSDCHFEYVTEAAFEATGFSDLTSGGSKPCIPTAGSIPADSSYHPIHAEITGLTSGTTYRYRLVATVAGALGGTGFGPTLAFTAPHAPRIDSTTAESLSSSFADLHARIDPLGAATTYHFEYLTQAEFEADGNSFVGEHLPAIVPVPDAAIGSGGPTGGADASVLQQIGGLAPATAYRFRVVASNEIGITADLGTTFTTLPQVVPGLRDGRAYELVTPPNKGSAIDMFGFGASKNQDVGYASPSGDQFLLSTTLAAFGLFPASENNAYVFSRTAGGWTFTSLASPSLGVQSIVPVGAFDPTDFSRVGINDFVGSKPSPAGAQLTSLLGPPGGPYAALHADSPVHQESDETEHTQLVGGSHDLSRVVLESFNHTLAPGAEAQQPDTHALYESAGGELKLLNLNSKGELLSPCGAVLGQGHVQGTTHNAVSADGSRVLFTAPDPYAANAEGAGGCWNGATVHAPQLYLRSGHTTTELSAPQPGAPEASPHHLAYYDGASEDGSRVFFLSEGELSADDAGIHDAELYEYDLTKPSAERLTRISAGEPGSPAATAGAGVFTVPAISADGSAVYFTASGQLTADAPPTSGEALNLYRYDTATGAIVYLATVNIHDYPNTDKTAWGLAGHQPWTGLVHDANWYTTPDGRYLLFATTHEQAGYGNAEATPLACPAIYDGPANGHCFEVYRYDSATASLACLSCNPSGAAPTSNALFARSAPGTPSGGPIRAISNDGSLAFFDTADALVPQDGNGTLDVYQWHNGQISLISSGHDSAPSFFLGAGADGRDVFFGTHARLLPADIDGSGDLYDARIGGGFPSSGSGVGPCEGDACSNPPVAPAEPTLASSVSSGSGNPRQPPPSCRKGFAKRHGRCVRQKSRHKRRRRSAQNHRGHR
jgi:hypothetical protein